MQPAFAGFIHCFHQTSLCFSLWKIREYRKTLVESCRGPIAALEANAMGSLIFPAYTVYILLEVHPDLYCLEATHYIHIHMCINMSIYINTYTHMHIYILHIHKYTHIHIHTFTHTHIPTYTNTHIHTYTYTQTHTHTHTHTQTHTHTHTHTHTLKCMHVSVLDFFLF